MSERKNQTSARLNVRVPKYLKDKIDQRAAKLGMTQSDLVRHAIILYLDGNFDREE